MTDPLDSLDLVTIPCPSSQVTKQQKQAPEFSGSASLIKIKLIRLPVFICSDWHGPTNVACRLRA